MEMMAQIAIKKGDGVVVALSGGADSVALLSMLVARRESLGLALFAVHVNHGLRAEAAGDEEFVRELCARWAVPLRVFCVDVHAEAKGGKVGVEEAGRRARYAAFQTALEDWGADKIATGHNLDDNAETVLLNLCRGAGLRGLCGIPPVSGNIIRPLLETSRAQIEAYLMKEGIPFVTDASNAGNAYARNRMRNIILPALAEHINPNAAGNMARNTDFLRVDADYLEAAAREAYAHCAQVSPTARDGHPAVVIDIPRLLALPEALRYRVAREAAARARHPHSTGNAALADIHAIHIRDVLRLAGGPSGREVRLPGLTARREYDGLCFFPGAPACAQSGFCYPLTPGTPLFVPEISKLVTFTGCTQSADYGILCAPMPGLCLRTRRPGDRISHSKKLQDYFTDNKVPRHRRDAIALVAVGSEIIWILDEKNKITKNGRHYMVPGETVEMLLSAAQIEERLNSLAEEINRDYGDKPIILVCALTGGVFFLADLARKLGNKTTLDFVRASSYGDGTSTSGKVLLDCHPKLDLRGKDVLVVEDIIDTGHTLAYLKKYVEDLNVASVRICALLDKPSRRLINVKADYVGFSIPDAFVVGYGLDYAQRYRNLPYVGVLKFTN